MDYSKKIRELREANSDLHSRAKAIVDLAVTEDRPLTSEEETEFGKREEEIADNKKAIERFESLEKNERDNAQTQARAVGDHSAKPEENKEVRQFSFGKFLVEATGAAGATGFEQYRSGLTGVEKEMAEEARTEAAGLNKQVRGYGIPGIILNEKKIVVDKRDLTAGTDTTGGYTVETTVFPNIIEYLRTRLVLVQTGATFLTGLQGDLSFPRNDAIASFAFLAENATAAETTPTFDAVAMAPKRLSGFIDLSKQLIIQSKAVPSIESFVMEQIMAGIAEAVQNAAINGDGSGANPTGVRNQSGVSTVSMGTPDGGAPTWAKMVEFETTLAADDADRGSISFVTNSKVRGKLKTTDKGSDTGNYIWNTAESATPVNGYPVAITSQVPSNLVEGASGATLSSIVFGNWQDLMIGQWGGLDIGINPYTKMKEALIEYVPNMYMDVAVRHPESFVVSDDVITV
jgi:HK97 family phage major capsid protein